MKSKQELMKIIKSLARQTSQNYPHEEMVELPDVINAINQLDEPTKPIIPQFVADWIEKWKKEGLTMHEWFSFDFNDEDEDKVAKWLYDNDYEENTRREYLLIDAIRYGYEVEKEKLYTVDLPPFYELIKRLDRNTYELKRYSDSGLGDYINAFTEQEIKEYDERYWAFSEEVTE